MAQQRTHHATLVIQRRFDAAPERVFHFWADPVRRGSWDFPGEGWTAEQVESDFRVGGRKLSRFGPPGGTPYVEDLRYEDIVPDQRIVFAYTISLGEARLTASLATIEFAPDGGGTGLKLTEQMAILDGQDTSDLRRAGWTEALDKLAAALAGQPQTA